MVSIKVKYRPSTVVDKEGTIYYQIIHDRVVRQQLTGYKIFPSEWNEKRAMPVILPDSVRMEYLMTVIERVHLDVERLSKIVRMFENSGLAFTADDIVERFDRYTAECSLFSYMESLIGALVRRNKAGTAESYRTTLKSLRRFRGGEDIMLDAVTPELMLSYESSLKNNGLTPNTTSFYMRNLRAVYNRAVEAGIIDDRRPFRRVYTGVSKTVKRALSLTIVRKIKRLDLAETPATDYARDMFLMSFYLRGMSFVDMSYLCKSDLKAGQITYRRRKTGQRLVIEWKREMQAIIDKYPANPTEFLLPILTRGDVDLRVAYKNAGSRINHHLKKIGVMVKAPITISMYCARHSWASAARKLGIPVSVISEAMGHDSEATTQIYLDSLETSVVDRANARILSAIR